MLIPILYDLNLYNKSFFLTGLIKEKMKITLSGICHLVNPVDYVCNDGILILIG